LPTPGDGCLADGLLTFYGVNRIARFVCGEGGTSRPPEPGENKTVARIRTRGYGEGWGSGGWLSCQLLLLTSKQQNGKLGILGDQLHLFFSPFSRMGHPRRFCLGQQNWRRVQESRQDKARLVGCLYTLQSRSVMGGKPPLFHGLRALSLSLSLPEHLSPTCLLLFLCPVMDCRNDWSVI
jgi:hypothetical protein